MTTSLDLLDTDGTLIKPLTGLVADADGNPQYGWTHPRRGNGAGTLAIHTTHPDHDLLTEGRMIGCNLDGTPTGFGWELQDQDTVWLSDRGREEEITLWRGQGCLSKLNEGAIIGRGNSGLMVLGWPVTGWDRTAWTDPVSFGQQQNPDSRIPVLKGSPPNWPDGQSEWLGPAALVESGGRVYHDERTWYITRTLRASGRSYSGPVRIFMSATNRWDFRFEGEHMAQGSGHADVRQVDVELEDGVDYTLAWRIVKDAHPEWNVSPTLLNMTVVTLVGEGQLGAVLYRTFTDAYQPTSSPGPWKVLDGEPSGLVWTNVAVRGVDETKNDPARGSLAGITVDAGYDLDTDGVPWEVTLPLDTYRDGEQLGDVLLQACQKYKVDMAMGPDLVLHGYVSLGEDVSGTVTLVPLSARKAVRGPRGNAARVEIDGEHAWIGNPVGVRREIGVTYGLASSLEEIRAGAEQLLEELRGSVRQTIRTTGPAGARPYTDFGPGDTVGVPEAVGGAAQPSRVESIIVVPRAGDVEMFEVETERRT